MAEEAGVTDTDAPADDSNADRWLIVAFVVCILLGLGVLGWHYRTSDQAAPLCSNADARCGDKTDPGAQ
jgi:hypothetical protein